MKKFLFLIFCIFLSINTSFANTYVEKTISGLKFRVIKYDTKSKDYIFKVGANPDYSATSLRTLMEKNNGVSAINGVFFCPADYRECGGEDFTKNERYIQGFKIGTEDSTGDRVVFGVDKKNNPFLFQTDKINQDKEKDIFYGLANFPLLLENGESRYENYVELGLVDAKMKAKKERNFICSDKNGKYIYTGYTGAIELDKLPEVLLEFGCYNALNLDAGFSNAMIYNGRHLVGPGRDILDGVIIERKGLNTNEITKSIDNIIPIVQIQLDGKSIDYQVSFLETLVEKLTITRKEIYEKNSRDLFDEKQNKIGYEINIKKIDTLAKVYTINYLIKSLYELENKFVSKEKLERQNEKKLKDIENGLF